MTSPVDAGPGTRRAEALRLLADLVAFPTLTSDSNLDLIAYTADHLTEVGAHLTTTYDDERRKANLFATIGPMVDGGVVLSGHTDVVPAEGDWISPPFELDVRDGLAFGRGTADMKGFIACALAMAERFAAADLRVPVHLALTYDEEVGCLGAPVLLAELLRTGPRPSAAIVGEPTSFRAIVGHKGCYEYTTTITGLEGHASAPARGVNAVEESARYIARLLELRDELVGRAPDDSPYDPPHTTISVGTINGGTARNVLAGTCSFDWDLRPIDRADAEHVAAAVEEFERDAVARMRRTHPGAAITTLTIGAVDGLEPVASSPARALVDDLLDGPAVDLVPFGTEAGLFQEAGIPAVVCGPGSIDVAHMPDEHISIDDLDACLAMLDRLADRLTGGAA